MLKGKGKNCLYRRIILILAVVVLVLVWTGCNSNEMTARQQEVLRELLRSDQEIPGKDIKNIKLSEEAAKKFPSVKKAYALTSGGKQYYAFAACPLGYRSAIDLFIVIDGEKNEVLGARVMQHDETPVYGDSLTKEWFLNRFRNKSTGTYLNRVVLEASQPNDIIQITGATVSSQGVINGVNAAIGAYREVVLGKEAQPVSLEVEGFVTEIK